MVDDAALLTAAEAAVVSSVSLRDVNRVIDERLLPAEFMRPDGGRMLEAAACALISFYFTTAKRLTAEERLRLIGAIGPKLLAAGSGMPRKSDWAVQDEWLTVDLAPFIVASGQRLKRLAAARARVTISSAILSGTPVVGGTRVPVHDVAASLEAGISPEDVLAGYPTLETADLELCRIYAQAYPLRGRPRLDSAPAGATILTDRRIARRKAG